MRSFQSISALLCFAFLALSTLSLVEAKEFYGTHKVVAYVVDWELPEDIQWSKLDHVVYAFAEPNENGELTAFSVDQLKSVVKTAHEHKVGVSLAIGGWTGSKYFSKLFSTRSGRSKVLKSVLAAVKDYDLDGINIDYEYPNSEDGMICNTHSKDDTNNLYIMLNDFKINFNKEISSKKILISVAVSGDTYNDAAGNPSTNLKKFNNVIDSVYIMNYDVNGNWDPTTGPNAPLYVGPKGERMSGTIAIENWHKAGFPLNKLVLGVPFYGWITKVDVSKMTNQYVKYDSYQIKGDQYDSNTPDPCPGAPKAYSGEIQWRSIVSDGVDRSTNGWKAHFDTTTDTPWAFDESKKYFVTYDNVKSIELKAEYVKNHKLQGIFTWSLEMDDSKHSLLNAMQKVY